MMKFLRTGKQRGSKAALPELGPPKPKPTNYFFPVFWATADAERMTRRMEEASSITAHGYHFADNLFTWARNNSMLDDDEFIRSWAANAESDNDKAIIWRRYILACA